MSVTRRILAGAAAVAAAASVSLVSPTAAQAATTSAVTCRVTWGSLPKTVNMASAATGSLATDLRTGHHTCYDRVVVEVDGKVGASGATYVSEFVGPRGERIIALGSRTGLVPPNKPFDMRPTGYRTAQALVYGGKEDGFEAIGIVTRARLPYRLFVVKGPGTHNRLVIDVAHRW